MLFIQFKLKELLTQGFKVNFCLDCCHVTFTPLLLAPYKDLSTHKEYVKILELKLWAAVFKDKSCLLYYKCTSFLNFFYYLMFAFRPATHTDFISIYRFFTIRIWQNTDFLPKIMILCKTRVAGLCIAMGGRLPACWPIELS